MNAYFSRRNAIERSWYGFPVNPPDGVYLQGAYPPPNWRGGVTAGQVQEVLDGNEPVDPDPLVQARSGPGADRVIQINEGVLNFYSNLEAGADPSGSLSVTTLPAPITLGSNSYSALDSVPSIIFDELASQIFVNDQIRYQATGTASSVDIELRTINGNTVVLASSTTVHDLDSGLVQQGEGADRTVQVRELGVASWTTDSDTSLVLQAGVNLADLSAILFSRPGTYVLEYDVDGQVASWTVEYVLLV